MTIKDIIMDNSAQIYYSVVSLLSMVGTYFLMAYIWNSGSSYPSAIPTIMIITSILGLIALLIIFFANMDTKTPITIRYTIFRILAVAVMWGLANVVLFLFISFFVMVNN